MDKTYALPRYFLHPDTSNPSTYTTVLTLTRYAIGLRAYYTSTSNEKPDQLDRRGHIDNSGLHNLLRPMVCTLCERKYDITRAAGSPGRSQAMRDRSKIRRHALAKGKKIDKT